MSGRGVRMILGKNFGGGIYPIYRAENDFEMPNVHIINNLGGGCG